MESASRVVFRTFSSVAAAEAAAASLEVNGVECVIQADDAGGMLPSLQIAEGVKLLVAAGKVAEAEQILASESSVSPETLEALSCGTAKLEPEPAAKPTARLLPLIVAFLLGAAAVVIYQAGSRVGTKTYRWDTNGDGKPDQMQIVRDGHVIESARDRNFDGRFDEWYFYERGCLGRFEADENFDGIVDHWWSYSKGLPVEGRLDTDFNGVPDVFAHCEKPGLVTMNWRPNGTNVITLQQVFRYGVLSEEFREANSDGFFDVQIKYDAFENPIQTNYLKSLSVRPAKK